MLRVVPALLLLVGAVRTASQDAASVFAKSKNAIVTVTTHSGVGTGFIIGDGTLLVTCNHVIKGEPVSGIKINLVGNRIASMVASNEDADIAVFRLASKAPKSLSLHTGESLEPGTKVFVIGTPLGFLNQTITEGIVSGVRLTTNSRLLQITAAISPGSSGSPVFNSSGRVVGMVKGSIEEGQSLNFAVSASDIRRVQSESANLSQLLRTEGWPTGDARLKDLASKLGSMEWGDEAARKLVSEGGRAVPFLIAALKVFHGDRGALNRARDALASIGEPAVNLLIRTLSDSEMWTRISSAAALGKIKDTRAVSALILALSDSEVLVRGMAAAALSNFKDTRSVSALILALSDSEALVRGMAAAALGAIKDTHAVQPLILALSDSEVSVRSMAAAALGRMKDTRAVEPLRRLLNDPDDEVRNAARDAIHAIKGNGG